MNTKNQNERGAVFKKTVLLFVVWNIMALGSHTVSQIKAARDFAQMNPVVAQMTSAGFTCKNQKDGSLACANARGFEVNFEKLLLSSR